MRFPAYADTAGLQGLTGVLSLGPYAQEVSAPQFGNILLGGTPAEQFGVHILALSFILPAHHASPMIDVRGDADVIDADPLDRVLNRIDKLGATGRRRGGQRPPIPVAYLRAVARRQSC